MDIQQLKLAAERVRTYLAQSSHPVGHNQSLDIIAALPGLRNWPEVQAFPDRVTACVLDTSATSRLSFRVKKKFDIEISPQELLAMICSSDSKTIESVAAPQIWPSGPKPGIYVTTSQDAINALVEQYEEATDGELVYAERAGMGAGSIDLGEYGLWSNGLARVPSGTLIVVGPIELDQQSWSDASERLEMACLHTLNSRHRIAVLLSTPTPETICEDVALILRNVMNDEQDVAEGLVGVISEEGQMLSKMPFANPWPQITFQKTIATSDAIPTVARQLIEGALSQKKSGILVLSSSEIQDHWSIELVTAALALTEECGPAARVMPRHRSTPSKDWLVPDAIKALPFLPSIESAYDQGYRRIIFDPNYTQGDTLLTYSDDALLIGGAHGASAEEGMLWALRFQRANDERSILSRIIALLGVRRIQRKKGPAIDICDLYVGSQDLPPPKPDRLMELADYVAENRVIRWEDELGALLTEGIVTPGVLTKSLPRDGGLKEFLASWQKRGTEKSV